MSLIYQTLANQTAHQYYIWQEQRKQSASPDACNQHGVAIETMDHKLVPQLNNNQNKQNTINHDGNITTNTNDSTDITVKPLATYFNKRAHARLVADDFLVVSNNLRGLMCDFENAFRLFNIEVPTRELVQQVLHHSFNSHISCARMAVEDCILMKNSVRIFAQIEAFLRNESGNISSLANRKQQQNYKQTGQH